MTGITVFWSLVIGMLFAYLADHEKTGAGVRVLFTAFATLFFGLAFVAMGGIVWSAL